MSNLSTDREAYDYIFKYILIGNGNSGKTSLLYHCIHSKQKKSPTQTIGVEFSSKLFTIGHHKIKLQLWDTAGQERYRSLARTYYRGALGALIIYDVTNPQSFFALDQWIKDAREFSKPDIEIIVVGNKSDLIDERQVSSSEAQRFCQENYVTFIETSAVTGMNVEEAFNVLSKKILEKIEKGFLDGDNLKPRFLQGTITAKQRSQEVEQKNCQC